MIASPDFVVSDNHLHALKSILQSVSLAWRDISTVLSKRSIMEMLKEGRYEGNCTGNIMRWCRVTVMATVA